MTETKVAQKSTTLVRFDEFLFFTVSLHEVGFYESKNGLQHGCSPVKTCKLVTFFFTQILMQKLSHVSLSYIDADVSISWISATYTLPTRFFDDIPFWASARAASI